MAKYWAATREEYWAYLRSLQSNPEDWPVDPPDDFVPDYDGRPRRQVPDNPDEARAMNPNENDPIRAAFRRKQQR